MSSTPESVENECVIVYANIPDTTTAEDLAKALIVRNMAATISIMPEIKTYKASIRYDVKQRSEVLMIIKTRKRLVEKLTDFIKLNCPYPDDKVDIASVTITSGNQPYLKWIYKTSNWTVIKAENTDSKQTT